MVLMTVGEHIAAHPVFVGGQVGSVRYYQIDAQHIVVGENGAAVHHQDIIFIFNGGHVFADFIDAAQRYNPHFGKLGHKILLPFSMPGISFLSKTLSANGF